MRGRLSAALAATLLLLAAGAPGRAAAGEFGIASLSASLTSSQAGAHPDFTLEFEMKSGSTATSELQIELPPGLLANPDAIPRCSAQQLVTTDVEDPNPEASCPIDSQVGVTEVYVYGEGFPQRFVEPIYNMDPPGGDSVARLGFFAKAFPVFIDAHLRSDGDYGVTTTIEGVGAFLPLVSAATTIWGVPAEESHDQFRVTPYEAVHCGGEPCTAPGGLPRSSGLAPAPFMTNPTSCGAARQVRVSATSYLEPDHPVSATTPLPTIGGCAKLGFAPEFEVLPTSREAAAPTGLDVKLALPQDETAKGLATSQLRDSRVTLPEGMTLAPGAADGLAACSAEQAAYKSLKPAHCPQAAKIGSAEIESPGLPETLLAAIYQRTPEPGHLFGIWLIADDLGVHLALPGQIEVDKETGQVTSLFLDTPQVPLRELRLHFKSGSRAPLANPPACGTYQTHFEFSPWSGKAPVSGETPMTVDEGCGTGGFAPKLSAGTASPTAGSFSPFLFNLTREAGEQNVAALDVTMPPGVVARLAGVPLCEGAAAASGDCPAASQVGAVTVAAGPGSSPLWIPQPGKAPTAAYLSGPYKGAPLGLVIKVPAQAGPFDLGTVISRATIHINPETAQVTVKSDPLPQILEGVPIAYRTIHVEIDRPGFTLNPTSCEPMSVNAAVTSSQGATANPSSRFQVGGCRELPFKPKLSLKLKGSTKRGGHPALTATLRARAGDANIASAQVTLPHSAFLDQGHLNNICTRPQFAARQCSPATIYGQAKAITPLLDFPLEGPVYLRSNPNHKLPDLVAALRGPASMPIEVDLVGRIDSFHGGIRSTFESVPDAPVTEFTLSMQGGSKGLLENSPPGMDKSLCESKSYAIARFSGQNGKRETLRPVMRMGCPKARRGKAGHGRHRAGHRRR